MRGVGVGWRDEASCMAIGIGHHRVGRHNEASCMAPEIKHACVNRAPRGEYGTKLATALVHFAKPSDCAHAFIHETKGNDHQRNLKLVYRMYCCTCKKETIDDFESHSEPGVVDYAQGWGW